MRQPKYIPLILYHKFLDIVNFRGSWEREKELLEIFSGNFFVEIFSERASQNFSFPKIGVPKLGFNLFLSKGRRSSPISLCSLGRLKLSQICEDFYSENLGSEDLVFRGVLHYALIGNLSKILI